jgi:fibronectin type 3 domain-containing protein
MRKLISTVFIAFLLLMLNVCTQAQTPATTKQGPAGIFVLLGTDIPSGKNISAYKIERSENNTDWKLMAEVSTPKDFDAFTKALEAAKSEFPSQPLPQGDKLSQLYQKAVTSGTTDSLKATRVLFPLRVALGIMYYDKTAEKKVTYRYRVHGVLPQGNYRDTYLSDTVSLPFTGVFDTITYSESSYNHNSVRITWKSAGKNPAPLFMVNKFRYGAPVTAPGTTSRYVMNDTTYYIYTDTTVAKDAGKEMQFFITPFDQYGNSGKSSQVAVITQDNFNKARFVRSGIAFRPDLAGVLLNFHFTDPVTVRKLEIFRGVGTANGFKKLAEVTANDTSFLDQQLWPETTYYYYVQAVAKAGKRTQQGDVMMARVPAIAVADKLKSPVLKYVSEVNGNIRLLIEVNDTLATQIRIFRGVKGGLLALPKLIQINGAAVISYTDSTLAQGNTENIFYAVRNEKDGSAISGLSAQLAVSSVTDANEVAYFDAFLSKGKIELYWDDVAGRSTNFAGYTLARQNGQANSKSPLRVVAENLKASSFADNDATAGNQYTYVLTLMDKAGNSTGKSYKVTIPKDL